MPVVEDMQLFDEEQESTKVKGADPDPHLSKKSDPDPDQNERSGPDLQQWWCGSATLASIPGTTCYGCGCCLVDMLRMWLFCLVDM
jgi:hypothetical protein